MLDAVSSRIDALLAEWQSRTTTKQRLTAARIHRQLLSEGYTISDRSVHLTPIPAGDTLKAIIEGAKYSVPSTWVGRTITALIGVEEICLCWQGATHVYAKQPRGAKVITYRHYLPALARKPQALRQVAPALLPDLGEPCQTLWNMLAKMHGEREAARVVAKLVAAIVAHGEGAVTTALTQVMQREGADLHAVHARLAAVPLPTHIAVPEQLAGYEVEAGKASDYDFLLAGELL